MTFSKKVVSEGGSGDGGFSKVSPEEWQAWNQHEWDAFDCDVTVNAKGVEVKERQVIGVLNYIQELGSQPQDDASMPSKCALPDDGEEHSAEELAVMKKFPTNYFKWVKEYKDGKEIEVRKVFWPKNPEKELILAIDFPEIALNQQLHPMADYTEETILPLRVDYNGKDFNDRTKLQRHVTNEVNYKTKKFHDRDIKYRIATAAGNVTEYINDQHDLAHLVQATCQWTVKMTRNEKPDGKVFFNTSIKDPAPVQTVKYGGKIVATVEAQLEDAKKGVESVPFCGILMNGGDYPDENLKQIRKMWGDLATTATTFDRNEGSNREGEWICGEEYEGSDFQKAFEAYQKKHGKTSGNAADKAEGSPAKETTTKPEAKAPEKVEVPKEEFQDTIEDFDDNIPF